VYLEEHLKSLGVVGLRGAVEIRFALEDIGLLKREEGEEDTSETDTKKPRHPDHFVVATHEVTVDAEGITETDTRYDVNPPDPAREAAEKAAREKAEKDSFDAATAAIAQAAKIVKVSDQALRNTLIQIGDDPTARFLSLSWSSLTSGR
jgi:archaellum component FlaD/FlaE